MDLLLLGQLLLGFLAVMAVLVNVLFMRLRRRYQRLVEIPSWLSLVLRWLPLGVGIMAVGALALAESSLLSYDTSQDVNGLSWFVIGACLMIVTDLCAGLALIALREALSRAESGHDLG